MSELGPASWSLLHLVAPRRNELREGKTQILRGGGWDWGRLPRGGDIELSLKEVTTCGRWW
jgi:hypothetical protein